MRNELCFIFCDSVYFSGNIRFFFFYIIYIIFHFNFSKRYILYKSHVTKNITRFLKSDLNKLYMCKSKKQFEVENAKKKYEQPRLKQNYLILIKKECTNYSCPVSLSLSTNPNISSPKSFNQPNSIPKS